MSYLSVIPFVACSVLSPCVVLMQQSSVMDWDFVFNHSASKLLILSRQPSGLTACGHQQNRQHGRRGTKCCAEIRLTKCKAWLISKTCKSWMCTWCQHLTSIEQPCCVAVWRVITIKSLLHTEVLNIYIFARFNMQAFNPFWDPLWLVSLCLHEVLLKCWYMCLCV